MAHKQEATHVYVQLTKVLCALPENTHRDTKNESMKNAIHSGDSAVYARMRSYTENDHEWWRRVTKTARAPSTVNSILLRNKSNKRKYAKS